MRADATQRDATADRDSRLLAAAEITISPVRVGITYQLGLVLVAAAMLVLPVLYLALIVALAYGVAWYAVRSPGVLFSGSGGVIWRVVLYVAPIFAGATGILFMVKPILARPPRPPMPTSLSPDEEPLLHGFVERLCNALGAPAPREIRVDMQVNASASFRRGVRSMLTSDLVLTLGLPFVTGLNVTQLAGILAHEFGHFSQAVAMRFSYLIASVNHWFARVVYERDEWDEKLHRALQEQSSGYAQLIVQLATFFVWLSRRLLWMLMYVGHVMSAYLSRQMEYNADRHQVQVVGSDGFRTSYLRMHVLHFAQQSAVGQVNALMSEGRLIEDLAALTNVHAERLEAQQDVRSQISHGAFEQRTRLFDTHPSGGDRARAAERLAIAPKMDCSEPARSLFRNFDALAARATSSLYQAQLGDAVASYTMLPTAEAAAGLVAAEESARAASRVFYGGAVMGFGIAPTMLGPAPPTTVDAGVAAVERARERATTAMEMVRSRVARHYAISERAQKLDDALLFAGAGMPFSTDELAVPTKDASELIRLKQSVKQEREESREGLAPVFSAIQERVAAAASLACHPEIREQLGVCERILEDHRAIVRALQVLEQNWRHLAELNADVRHLSILIAGASQYGEQEDFQQEANRLVKETHDILRLLCRRLSETAYPYQHARGPVSVADYMIPGQLHQSIQVFEDAGGALERLMTLYGRCWGDLALLVECVERSVGLPELDLELKEVG